MTTSRSLISQRDLSVINEHNGRVVVGFSGGLDSTVLLHLINKLAKRPIQAFHVNHGLCDAADAWEIHCKTYCKSLNVEFTCEKVDIGAKGNLEAAAREARYGAFEVFLETDDLLVLGHHQNDQLETAFFHLLKGNKPFGLQGMPKRRRLDYGELFRPLLSCPRAHLESYASHHDLSWIEDLSNADTQFDRNYLRHEVLPVLLKRWPNLASTIDQSLVRTNAASAEFEALSKADFKNISVSTGQVSLTAFGELSNIRQTNLLRYWLRKSGVKLMPSEQMLVDCINQFFTANSHSQPELKWSSLTIRRYMDNLYLVPMLKYCDKQYQMSSALLSNVEPNVDVAGQLRLSNGVLHIQKQPKGLAVAISDLDEMSVRFRQGGEKMRFGSLNETASSHHKTLKNLFQERKIPSFLRDYIPLIYKGDELMAVAGLKQWHIEPIICPQYCDVHQGVERINFDWQLR